MAPTSQNSSVSGGSRKGDETGSKIGRKGDPRMVRFLARFEMFLNLIHSHHISETTLRSAFSIGESLLCILVPSRRGWLFLFSLCFRLHRAVAARLADPELSLFDSLKIGGFEYEDDTDPSACDSENITLGQRKNQLSRRLRLAKKSDGTNTDNSFDAAAEESTGRLHSGQSKTKQKSPPKSFEEATSDNLSGKKRASESTEQALGVDAHVKNLKDLEDRLAAEQKRQREEPAALAAKYHPDFHHIIIPRGAGGLAFSPSASWNSHRQTQPVPAQDNQPETSIQEQLMASGLTGGLSNFALSSQKARVSMPPPSISNVAIRSLNATARSAGITLEQLALALSTSKNLMQLLSGINSDESTDGDSQKKKNELALKMHEYETKTLYSRCMVLAGFGHDEANEGNPAQLRFALEAWQNEGKRLQELIRNSTDVVCDEAPTIHNVAEQQLKGFSGVNTEQARRPVLLSTFPFGEVKTDINHSLSNSHSHYHQSDARGRHIHRLEGKCGHRAILHQPKGGTPHIDFVVGDKVECYGDVQPSPQTPSHQWPSQYRCDELDCTATDPCSKVRHGDNSLSTVDGATARKAKVLDLSSVDLTTQEWTVDFNDDVLMSLFRLSDKGTFDNGEQQHLQEIADDSGSTDNKSTQETLQGMYKM
ncbi:hypothetical protein ACA910_011313 [Epithemia clementina (nom. ined.)]